MVQAERPHGGAKHRRLAEAMEFNRPGVIRKYEAETLLWQDYDRPRRCTVCPEAAPLMLKSLHYFTEQGFVKGATFIPDEYPRMDARAVGCTSEKPQGAGRGVRRRLQAGKTFLDAPFPQGRTGAVRASDQQRRLGAGRALLGITYDGHVVPCHRFSREPAESPMCLGTVKQLLDGAARGFGPEWTARMEFIQQRKELPQCVDCVARNSCQKGCYHCNWGKNHDLSKPTDINCAVNREAARLTLWIDRKLRGIDAYWWKRKLPGKGQGASAAGPTAAQCTNPKAKDKTIRNDPGDFGEHLGSAGGLPATTVSRVRSPENAGSLTGRAMAASTASPAWAATGATSATTPSTARVA